MIQKLPLMKGRNIEGNIDLSCLRHVGLVTNNLENGIAFFKKLGVGRFEVFQPDYYEKFYLGEKGNFRMKIAIAPFGPIEIELIEPLEGESVYTDFLKKTGGGFHHLAYEVQNLDTSVEKFKKIGAKMVMSGARKGVRFAYFDANNDGIILEMIEKR